MESFSGTVVRGKQLGRTIGFPTANLDTAASPAGGVYAVVVTAKGERYRGIMNVGSHPTAPEGAPTVEVHLLDFEGDLYGDELRVDIVQTMREERKFDSLGALKEQLRHDEARARAIVKL